MGGYAAAVFGYVEVGSFGVSCKYRVPDAVVDAVVGIGGKAIKELEHDPVCVFSG